MSIFQIYCGHETVFCDHVYNGFNAIHFKMFIYYKFIQLFQVQNYYCPTIRLFIYKYWRNKFCSFMSGFLIICLCNISSKITWISISSSGEKLGSFALCFMEISFSNSIVSPLTICNINLSDVSFCHS